MLIINFQIIIINTNFVDTTYPKTILSIILFSHIDERKCEFARINIFECGIQYKIVSVTSGIFFFFQIN